MRLEMFVWFVIGVFVEAIVASIIEALRTTRGVLKVDCSDPKKDRYKIEVDNLDVIPKKKFLVLKIDTRSDLSQD